jgi:hypothetical protein
MSPASEISVYPSANECHGPLDCLLLFHIIVTNLSYCLKEGIHSLGPFIPSPASLEHAEMDQRLELELSRYPRGSHNTSIITIPPENSLDNMELT